MISYIGETNIDRIQLISHSGKTIDLSRIVLDLTIYEDIFSSTLSGYILVQDANDLVATLPMIGQEQVQIKLNTPTLTTGLDKTFYIYKMNVVTFNKRSQSYMLYFCSKELIYSANVKVAKAFSGNITDTVNEIFRSPNFLNSNSTLFVDRTKNDYKFIAPYWSPIETINWLAQRSINSNGAPNYVFFETSQSFEYVSIDRLIESPVKKKYIFSDIDPNTVYGVDGDIDAKYSIVESVDPGIAFDYLKNITSGMLAARLHTLDLTTKNINSSGFDYLDDFNKFNHLDKYPLRTEDVTRKKASNVFFIEKNNYISGSYWQQGYKDFFLQRNSLLEQLSGAKLNIKVPGRTDIKVGHTIHLTIPKNKQIAGEDIDKPSDYYTGKYLITAIRHQFLNSKHTMEMEIVSDSFSKPIKTFVQ